MSYHEFNFKSCTGDHLFACSFEPETRARINIIIIHGLGEHCGRYKEFAEYLVSEGYGVYTYDYRGFGQSPGRKGHIDTFDSYFQDLKRFVEIISDPWQRTKTIILGHSLGGLIGLAYALKYPGTVDGYIITSPGLKAYPIPKFLEYTVKILNKLLPWLSFTNRLSADHLSHDPQVVEKYLKDPLVHDKITPRMYTEIQNIMKQVKENANQLKDPLLLLYAGADQIVDPKGAEEFAQNLPKEIPKEIHCYEEMYHELLNEQEKSKVWTKIKNWLEKISTNITES